VFFFWMAILSDIAFFSVQEFSSTVCDFCSFMFAGGFFFWREGGFTFSSFSASLDGERERHRPLFCRAMLLHGMRDFLDQVGCSRNIFCQSFFLDGGKILCDCFFLVLREASSALARYAKVFVPLEGGFTCSFKEVGFTWSFVVMVSSGDDTPCTCIYMYIYIYTANPTWGDIFESSKLKAQTSLLPRFNEKSRCSFEL